MATRRSRTSAGVKVGCARLDVGPEGRAVVPDGVPSDRAGGRDPATSGPDHPSQNPRGRASAGRPCDDSLPSRPSIDGPWLAAEVPAASFLRLRPNERRPNSSPRLREGQAARTAAAQHAALRTRTKHHKPALLLWCNALLREVRWWASWRRSLDGMQGITGLPGVPCYGSSCRAKPAGGLEETQPMTWIIIALLFAAAAAAGFRLQALTRDEPPEPPLAHRWRRTMGGG